MKYISLENSQKQRIKQTLFIQIKVKGISTAIALQKQTLNWMGNFQLIQNCTESIRTRIPKSNHHIPKSNDQEKKLMLLIVMTNCTHCYTYVENVLLLLFSSVLNQVFLFFWC